MWESWKILEKNLKIPNLTEKQSLPDLSLDIPEKYYKDLEDTENKQVCHISDCLSSFTEVEELAETELYYCSACKCKQKSTKRFWVRRLPNVLCLHIKRFRWNNFFRFDILNFLPEFF